MIFSMHNMISETGRESASDTRSDLPICAQGTFAANMSDSSIRLQNFILFKAQNRRCLISLLLKLAIEWVISSILSVASIKMRKNDMEELDVAATCSIAFCIMQGDQEIDDRSVI